MKYNKFKPLELQPFLTWFETKTVNYASISGDLHLSLEVSLKGNIIIKKNDVVVWQGIQPYAAVGKFNALLDSFKHETN